MTDKYQAIRDALAAGPTPGPWLLSIGYGEVSTLSCNVGIIAHLYRWYGNGGEADTNAMFIAACYPETITALLAERDALREALRPLAELLRGCEIFFENGPQIVYQRDKGKITVGDVHRAAELLEGDNHD